MIPASQTIVAYNPKTGAEFSYDSWTPTAIEISRTGEGMSSTRVVLRRSRLLENGNTHLMTDDLASQLEVAATVEMTVADIYADASDEYPAESRDAVLAVAPGLIGAVALLAASRGVL